jgi:hypothetical protein
MFSFPIMFWGAFRLVTSRKTNKGLCHIIALPFTLKSISGQKKNYGNSNISPCQDIIIFKKFSKRNQNPSRYYYNSYN